MHGAVPSTSEWTRFSPPSLRMAGAAARASVRRIAGFTRIDDVVATFRLRAIRATGVRRRVAVGRAVVALLRRFDSGVAAGAARVTRDRDALGRCLTIERTGQRERLVAGARAGVGARRVR